MSQNGWVHKGEAQYRLIEGWRENTLKWYFLGISHSTLPKNREFLSYSVDSVLVARAENFGSCRNAKAGEHCVRCGACGGVCHHSPRLYMHTARKQEPIMHEHSLRCPESGPRWVMEGSGHKHLENKWSKAKKKGLKQKLKIAILCKCKATSILRCFAHFSTIIL